MDENQTQPTAPAKPEDGRLHDTGDIIDTPQGRFEVTQVSYQETDGKRHTFTYGMRPADEVQTERDVEAAHQASLAKMAEDENKGA